jgi:hypothetical protein
MPDLSFTAWTGLEASLRLKQKFPPDTAHSHMANPNRVSIVARRMWHDGSIA